MSRSLVELVDQIAAGSLQVQVGRVFHLDEIVEAHCCMMKLAGTLRHQVGASL